MKSISRSNYNSVAAIELFKQWLFSNDRFYWLEVSANDALCMTILIMMGTFKKNVYLLTIIEQSKPLEKVYHICQVRDSDFNKIIDIVIWCLVISLRSISGVSIRPTDGHGLVPIWDARRIRVSGETTGPPVNPGYSGCPARPLVSMTGGSGGASLG